MKKGKGLIKEFYINGKLKFEGEYLNELITGKGKLYDNDGILMVEGEYLNGLITWKGKEYDKNGKLKIESEYLYDKRLKSKYYIKERLEYEGDYIIKKYNGKGYDEKGNEI